MKYTRFEELPVWQAASKLAVDILVFTAHSSFPAPYALKDQLQRAALSISNNIAEGFERGTNQELSNFVYIARGSAGEVRSMLWVLLRLPGAESLESGILNLKSQVEGIARQLGGWAASIRNSDFKGQRHVSEKLKEQDRRAQDRKAFLADLKKFREQA